MSNKIRREFSIALSRHGATDTMPHVEDLTTHGLVSLSRTSPDVIRADYKLHNGYRVTVIYNELVGNLFAYVPASNGSCAENAAYYRGKKISGVNLFLKQMRMKKQIARQQSQDADAEREHTDLGVGMGWRELLRDMDAPAR